MKDACKLKTSGSSKSVKGSVQFYGFFALAMSLGWTGWSTPSFGQATEVTSPDISPPPPGDVVPASVPADTELGIPLGSFRLYPTLDVRAGYDTNVFASSGGQQTGSAYEAIRPSLDVRSDWNNHMLNFGGYGAFGFFNSATSQNYQNFGFNTDGRLDIYRDWYLTGNAAFTGTTAELFQSGHHKSPGQTPAPSHIRTISTEYRSGPCIPSGPSFKSARSTNSQPAMARIRTPVQTSPVMSLC